MKEKPEEFLTLMHYKEPLKKVIGGFGYYGALQATVDGTKLQCHICGELHSGLGRHIAQKHDISVSDYRDKYGLARKTALVSEKLRGEMKQRTIAWIKRMEEKHGNVMGRAAKEYDDEELLEYLRIFYEQTGKIPTETDTRRGLVPPSTTYARHFGSLPLARERAGIYGSPTRYGVKNI